MATFGAGASRQKLAIATPALPVSSRHKANAKYWLAIVMLMFACMFWGFGNVAQKIALRDISPQTLLFARSAIAAICLTPFAILEWRNNKITLGKLWTNAGWLALRVVAFALGLASQTIGGQYTSATNLGFLINLCVLFTPLILFLAVGQRVNRLTIVSCLVCFAGAVLLTGLHMQVPGFGDALCLLGAVYYAVWIIALDRTLKRIDAPILITCLQFVPLVAFTSSVALPHGELYSIKLAVVWPSLLFVSVLGTCVSFLIASYAQRLVQPVVAAMIYSFEALFGALAAWAVIGEQLSPTATIGGALMFASILLCQLCAAQQAPRVHKPVEKFTPLS